jgi:predicted RNA-binding protein with PIN domain
MGLHLIIDGYNLIRQSPELGRIDRRDITAGRTALLERLAAYRRLKPYPITVVFDGAGAPEATPERDRVKGVRVVFSRHGETADAVIARLARQDAERAIVVTSDRGLARLADAAGATVIDALEFEGRVAMALALGGDEPRAEVAPERRVSTRKKGEGRRLPKKMRQTRKKAEKL